MRNLLMTIFILFYHNLHSQNVVKKLPIHKLNEEPTLMINNALSSYSKIETLKPRKIKNIEVIKFKKTGAPHIDNIPVLGEYGIIKVSLKKTPKTITKVELNLKNNLPPNNEIYYDGFLIEYKDINICVNTINEIEIVKANSSNKLKTNVINIWTIEKENRQIKPIPKCSFGLTNEKY